MMKNTAHLIDYRIITQWAQAVASPMEARSPVPALLSHCKNAITSLTILVD